MAECSTIPNGAGTVNNPYVLTDVCELNWIRNEPAAHYILGNDIDASDTATWNGGQGWVGHDFSGVLNGQLFGIHNLTINRPGTNNQGMFVIVSGTIRYLRLYDFSIVGRINTSIFLQNDRTGYMEYVSAIGGSVSNPTEQNVGGLVANNRGTLYRCSSSASVFASGPTAGGLVCQNSDIAGGGGPRMIRECFALGNVQASSYVGGLVGYSTGTIIDSYARGDVVCPAGHSAGGLIGYNRLIGLVGAGSIDNCFSTGLVSCPGANTGGLVGERDAGVSCTDSFWDIQTSGQVASNGGTGMTTAEMKTKTTFTGAGWDFVTIWDIDGIWNDGYPFLRWGGPPYIHVTVPNGGEIWDAGSTYTILWTHVTCLDPNTHVIIELLKGGVLDETISAGTPIGPLGGGTYNWTIDPGKTPGPAYRIRITGVTHPYTDTSDDDFTIRDPTIVPPAPAVATLPATEVG